MIIITKTHKNKIEVIATVEDKDYDRSKYKGYNAIKTDDPIGQIKAIEKHNERIKKAKAMQRKNAFKWDFSKLPKEEHKNVIEAVENLNTAKLIIIHDKYNLSTASYCCGSEAPTSVHRWFKWGIENGYIE